MLTPSWAGAAAEPRVSITGSSVDHRYGAPAGIAPISVAEGRNAVFLISTPFFRGRGRDGGGVPPCPGRRRVLWPRVLGMAIVRFVVEALAGSAFRAQSTGRPPTADPNPPTHYFCWLGGFGNKPLSIRFPRSQTLCVGWGGGEGREPHTLILPGERGGGAKTKSGRPVHPLRGGGRVSLRETAIGRQRGGRGAPP